MSFVRLEIGLHDSHLKNSWEKINFKYYYQFSKVCPLLCTHGAVWLLNFLVDLCLSCPSVHRAVEKGSKVIVSVQNYWGCNNKGTQREGTLKEKSWAKIANLCVHNPLQTIYNIIMSIFICIAVVKDGENTVLGVFRAKTWDLFSSLSWLEDSAVMK